MDIQDVWPFFNWPDCRRLLSPDIVLLCLLVTECYVYYNWTVMFVVFLSWYRCGMLQW